MEILGDILSSATYDLIKKIIIIFFHGPDDNRDTKLIKAINKAAKRFFDRYGDRFGTLNSSFLAFEENWRLIFEIIFYGKEQIDVHDFKVQGLGLDEVSCKFAIRDFIAILKEEMQNDWELDKILAEKHHIIETKEINRKISEIERVLDDLKNSNETIDDIEINVIARLKHEFNESIYPGLINKTLIHRDETDQCLNAIDENKLIILHGAAGYGKRVVLPLARMV